MLGTHPVMSARRSSQTWSTFSLALSKARTREGVWSSWDCSASFVVGLPTRPTARPAADLKYLRQWVAEHEGVEAFVEPKTTVTEVTVCLVAADGEWTRRRAGGGEGPAAQRSAPDSRLRHAEGRLSRRMRDFDARQGIERDRELRRGTRRGLTVTARTVTAPDGVRIAVYEQGNPRRTDDRSWCTARPTRTGCGTAWSPLLEDRYRVIRYDNRGAGRSDPALASHRPMPWHASPTTSHAVVGALSPDGPVHVLAHGWGSVGVWEYLARRAAADRVASFTSISGPSADHLNRFVVGGLTRPTRRAASRRQGADGPAGAGVLDPAARAGPQPRR